MTRKICLDWNDSPACAIWALLPMETLHIISLTSKNIIVRSLNDYLYAKNQEASEDLTPCRSTWIGCQKDKWLASVWMAWMIWLSLHLKYDDTPRYCLQMPGWLWQWLGKWLRSQKEKSQYPMSFLQPCEVLPELICLWTAHSITYGESLTTNALSR